MSKICKFCKKEYFMPIYYITKKRWESRKFCSNKCVIKNREGKKCKSVNKNEANPMWVGDKVKYTAVHAWIRRNYKEPLLCENCFKKKPYDLANISGTCKRNIRDWEWLCRKCHMLKDGRLDKFKCVNIGRKSHNRKDAYE